jgi:flagellar biosynthesis protein FlhF
MPQLTVTAEDTSSAMDEIVNKLGEDALIISTRKVGNKYEVSATNDTAPSTARRRRPADAPAETFMDVFTNADTELTVSENRSGDNPLKSEPVLETILETIAPEAPRDKPSRSGTLDIETPSDYNISEGNIGADKKYSRKKPSVMDALFEEPRSISMVGMSDQIDLLSAQISSLRDGLNGMILTEESMINHRLGTNLPLQLRQSGFSEKTIRKFSSAFIGKTLDEGRVEFMRAIANSISDAASSSLAQSKIIFVTGGRGSGKTSFVGKLATHILESYPGEPIALGEFGGANPSANSNLRNQARLLNLPINKVSTDDLDVTVGSLRGRIIIDCDGDASETRELIDTTRALCGEDGTAVFLTLPGTSNAKTIQKQFSAVSDTGAVIALTQLDECEVSACEFSVLAELEAKIAFLTASRSLIDTLVIASAGPIEQYLLENC